MLCHQQRNCSATSKSVQVFNVIEHANWCCAQVLGARAAPATPGCTLQLPGSPPRLGPAPAAPSHWHGQGFAQGLAAARAPCEAGLALAAPAPAPGSVDRCEACSAAHGAPRGAAGACPREAALGGAGSPQTLAVFDRIPWPGSPPRLRWRPEDLDAPRAAACAAGSAGPAPGVAPGHMDRRPGDPDAPCAIMHKTGSPGPASEPGTEPAVLLLGWRPEEECEDLASRSSAPLNAGSPEPGSSAVHGGAAGTAAAAQAAAQGCAAAQAGSPAREAAGMQGCIAGCVPQTCPSVRLWLLGL